MTPEKLAEIQLLRNAINDPATPEADRMAAVRKAVQMVREERGVISTRIEAKAKVKKAAAIDADKLLGDFLDPQS